MGRRRALRWGALVLALLTSPLWLNGLAALVEIALWGGRYHEGRLVGLYEQRDGRLALKPGASFRGLLRQVSVNELGFRGPAFAPAKPEDGLRIWASGGGTAFDIFASSDTAAWPHQLQLALGERTGRPVEVLNAGIPGEVVEGSIDDYRRLAPSLDVDWWVVYHGPNDLRTVLFMGRPPSPERRLPDYALVRLWSRLSPPVQPASWPDRRMTDREIDELRRRFDRLAQASRELGARVVLATHAHRGVDGATGDAAWEQMKEASELLDMAPEAVIEAFAIYNRMARERCQAERWLCVDVREDVGTDHELWGDAIHFADAGSARAGQAIASAIADVR